MIRVYLLRSTVLFCLPIARCRIGRQSALRRSFAFLQDVAPIGPVRLLMYTQRVFWRSECIVGTVVVGVDVGVVVAGMTVGVITGGFGGVARCSCCGG
jgi:hypothetical protein